MLFNSNLGFSWSTELVGGAGVSPALAPPKYELTEELINDGTFDYVPDSNNPDSSYKGKLTESDGTTPYLPDETEYIPSQSLLELANGRIMNTQFDIDEDNSDNAAYGIYDADGSSVYKIWAIDIDDTLNVYKLHEGDQDTPITETGTYDMTAEHFGIPWTVTDGRPSWMPSDVTIETYTQEVTVSSDDAEESYTGGTAILTSSDLELGKDVASGIVQTVGLRFTNVTIPKDSIIDSAYVQFEAKETHSNQLTIEISCQDIGDAPTFQAQAANILNRTRTAAKVSWADIPAWTSDEITDAQKTPDLKTIIQEVINHTDWVSGNDIVLLFDNTNTSTTSTRTAYSSNSSSQAPTIEINYEA